MKRKYPFDSSIKHHLCIALAAAIWIFIFLYFTQPLDVSELNKSDQLKYMPIYSLGGAICYLIALPFQYFILKYQKQQWYVFSEVIFVLFIVIIGLIVSRSVYLYIVVWGEPNPYPLSYFLSDIYIPAITTIFPIVIIGRWAFGKYKNKKGEAQKIELKGEGNYEGLRLHFNDVICVKADDNYIEVSYLDGNLLKKQLIRNKLSTIAETFPELLRTHRSYLINPYHFQQWKTEKGKSNVILQREILVPVSKTYTTSVKEAINLTTSS